MVAKPEPVKKPITGRQLSEATIHTRTVDFDQHGIHDAVIYDGMKLEPGMEFRGPAIIQEAAVTLVVSPGRGVMIDDYGNYRVDLGREG